MRRPSLLFALGLAIASCHSPAILGGPSPANTTHMCQDGLPCPNWLSCPPLAGGDCEAPVDAPPAMREADAGQHCRVTMLGEVCR